MERYPRDLLPHFRGRSIPTTYMNVFELTRALVDIDSVTPNEEAVGAISRRLFVRHWRRRRAVTWRRCAVEPHRFNVFAYWGEPEVTLSTHMDTVPPFYASQRG